MDENNIVRNDLAERYERLMASTPKPPEKLPTVQERESLIGADAGREGTLASHLLTDTKRSDYRMLSLIRAGKYAEAHDEYVSRNQVVDDNMEGMTSVVSMQGGGLLAGALRERAAYELSRKFNDLQVTTFDGRQTTVGEFFSDDSWKDPGRSYSDRGFSKRAVDALLNGTFAGSDAPDEGLKTAVGFFARAKDERGFDSMRIQNAEGANAVVDNWAEIREVCGTGAERFAQYVQETHRETGGAAPMVSAMLTLARAHRGSTGLTDDRLVDSAFGLYRRAAGTASREDAPAGGTRPRQMSPDEQLMFDATFAGTLADLEFAGGADFVNAMKSDVAQGALADVMSGMARARACGVDVALESESAVGGKSVVEHAVDYVAGRVRGDDVSANPFATWAAFDEGLTRQIVGARDFVPVQLPKSASPADHARVRRAAGGDSTCPEADNMAVRIHDCVKRALAPRMWGGASARDAWTAVNTDLVEGQALRNSLIDAIAPSFAGDGARAAAAEVADSVRNALTNNTRFNVEEELFRAAGNARMAKASPAAHAAIRNWVYGRTVADTRYGAEMAQLYRHLTAVDGWGLSEGNALSVLSMVKSHLAELDRANESRVGVASAKAYIDDLMNRGYMYSMGAPVPKRDPATGQPVTDPATGQPVTFTPYQRTWSSNLDRDSDAAERSALGDKADPRTTYGRAADPAGYSARQAELANEKAKQDAEAHAEAQKQLLDAFARARETRAEQRKKGSDPDDPLK